MTQQNKVNIGGNDKQSNMKNDQSETLKKEHGNHEKFQKPDQAQVKKQPEQGSGSK